MGAANEEGQSYPHAPSSVTSREQQALNEAAFSRLPGATALGGVDLGNAAAEAAAEEHSNGRSVQPELNTAQAVVKSFVRGLVKGRRLRILASSGGMAECIVFLDRGLTTLSLQRVGKEDAKKRAVPLQEIEEIAVGAESGQDYGLETDDMSLTLVLKSGQAIAFVFYDDEERDTFALCLTMFVDGRRAETERIQEKSNLRAA